MSVLPIAARGCIMMGDMTEDKFRDILNQELAKFIGQINRRFDGLEKQVASKADDAKVDKKLDYQEQ